MKYRVISLNNMPPEVIYQGYSINKAFSIAEDTGRQTHRLIEVQMIYDGARRWTTIQRYFYKERQEG